MLQSPTIAIIETERSSPHKSVRKILRKPPNSSHSTLKEEESFQFLQS